MDRNSRLAGINSFLAEVYSPLTDFSSLLGYVGFGQEQVGILMRDALDQTLAEYVRLLEARLLYARKDGPRLYQILCRRFALEGTPTATLQELGEELGITRERVRQLQQKALRSYRGTASRRFCEEGLRDYAMRLVGPPQGDRTAVASTIPQVGANVRSASDDIRSDQGHPDDIAFISGLLTTILQQLPDGLSSSMLTHILAGSSGVVVDAVVQHYHLAQYGMLKPLGFARVKDLIQLTCATDPCFVRINGQIHLRREGSG